MNLESRISNYQAALAALADAKAAQVAALAERATVETRVNSLAVEIAEAESALESASVSESLELRKTLRALKSARADLVSTLSLPALDVARQDRRVAGLHAKAQQIGLTVYAQRFRQMLAEKEAVAAKKWLTRARALQRLAQIEWPATLVAEKEIVAAQKEWVTWLSETAGG